MRIVFGGTFDPIHLGHIELAKRLYQHYRPTHFYFVPNFQNPHKSHAFASNVDRLKMVQLAIKEFPDIPFEVLTHEALSEKPSYTYLTVLKLYEQNDDPVAIVMGNEVFEGLPFWYEPKALLEKCDVILIPRDFYEVDLAQILSKIGIHDAEQEPSHKKWFHLQKKRWIEWFYFPKITFSSTEVRKEIQEKQVIPESLQRSVWQYIKENQLYTVKK